MIYVLALLYKTSLKLKLTTKVVLKEYYDFHSLFYKQEVPTLLLYNYVDYQIPLLLYPKLILSPIYSIDYLELKEVREYLNKNLSKAFI